MTGSELWTTGRGGLLALVATLILTPLVIRAARQFGWVDRPREDRWHEEATALMGGIAIFGGVMLGLLWGTPGDRLWILWGGAALLFVVGLVDDLRHVPPAAKLTVQVAAAGLLLYAGYDFGPDWPAWLSVPVTFLWIVGITNSINLLDNMDGLAAGIAGITALVLGGFAFLVGNPVGVGLGTAVAGGAFGFLAYNFKPARIFMGDCGSLFLGFVIAALALVVQEQAPVGDPVAVALVPLAVLAVPIFDTTLVTVLRKLSGRDVSQGGQDHTSHRLVVRGLSEQHAVLTLHVLSLLSGGLALFVLVVDVMLFYAAAAFLSVGIGILGVQLARTNVYSPESDSEGSPTPVRWVLGGLRGLLGNRWKAVVGVLGDVMLVGAAFVVAHYLHYEQGLLTSQKIRLREFLPLVIVAKVLVFYVGGLYRGIWRHAGTPEIIRTVSTTAVASVVTFGVLAAMYGEATVSLDVLIIDWMIVMLAVGGARFGFRGLRQYFASKQQADRRVLLYGAGEAGLLALREIRHNANRGLEAVAFVDDDPLKYGQSVQGLPVLNGEDDIEEHCREYDVDEVIITASAMPSERRRAICRACAAVDVSCRTSTFTFEPLSTSESAPPSTSAPVTGDGQP